MGRLPMLARRDGDEVTLTSKSGKPLGRYFPDVVEILRGLKEKQFLLDGELIIPVGDALSFEALQLRLHPAESRVRRLAAEHPAELMLFDLRGRPARKFRAHRLVAALYMQVGVVERAAAVTIATCLGEVSLPFGNPVHQKTGGGKGGSIEETATPLSPSLALYLWR